VYVDGACLLEMLLTPRGVEAARRVHAVRYSTGTAYTGRWHNYGSPQKKYVPRVRKGVK
jgi:hypothetical protein